MLMNANFGNHIVRSMVIMTRCVSWQVWLLPSIRKARQSCFCKNHGANGHGTACVKPVPGVEKVLAPNDPQMHSKKNASRKVFRFRQEYSIIWRELITTFYYNDRKALYLSFLYINQEQDMKALRPLTASLMR